MVSSPEMDMGIELQRCNDIATKLARSVVDVQTGASDRGFDKLHSFILNCILFGDLHHWRELELVTISELLDRTIKTAGEQKLMQEDELGKIAIQWTDAVSKPAKPLEIIQKLGVSSSGNPAFNLELKLAKQVAPRLKGLHALRSV